MNDEFLNQVKAINYHLRSKELSTNFEEVIGLLANHLTEHQFKLLRSDFDFYLDKGRWWVHNTFAGGIIFLREPEMINSVKIEFNTQENKALASVEYGSAQRNARNVKYKPKAGKIESRNWNMLGVFPNFSQHTQPVKIVLMAIIGKIVKLICENENKNGWFMKYEKAFEIDLFLDEGLELRYKVDAI